MISKVEIKEETCPIFSRKKMTEFTALTLIHSLYIDQRGCTSKPYVVSEHKRMKSTWHAFNQNLGRKQWHAMHTQENPVNWLIII